MQGETTYKEKKEGRNKDGGLRGERGGGDKPSPNSCDVMRLCRSILAHRCLSPDGAIATVSVAVVSDRRRIQCHYVVSLTALGWSRPWLTMPARHGLAPLGRCWLCQCRSVCASWSLAAGVCRHRQWSRSVGRLVFTLNDTLPTLLLVACSLARRMARGVLRLAECVRVCARPYVCVCATSSAVTEFSRT